jgi:hypothetical protein
MALEITLPTNPKELRLRHLEALELIGPEGVANDKEALVALASFCGVRYNQILDFTRKQVGDMAQAMKKVFNRMDIPVTLPERIEVNGKAYTLINPDKVGVGWHIDWTTAVRLKDPVRFACMFYFPEGANYSDEDENKNLLYPVASRYEDFKAGFELSLYLAAAPFFLRKSERSISKSTESQRNQAETRRELRNLKNYLRSFGRTRSTQ